MTLKSDFLDLEIIFQLPKRKIYAWMSPYRTTRNQIDYILLPKSFRNDVKSAKMYLGADVRYDHNLVVIEIKLKFRKKIKPKLSILSEKYEVCQKVM